MNVRLQSTAAAAAGALALFVAPVHAAVSTYDTQAQFLAAVSAPGTDTFDDLAPGLAGSSYARTAGGYAYTATALGSSPFFFPVGTGGDTWLSTDAGDDTIVFSGFGSNVGAIGGQFFGTDSEGNFFAGQPLTLSLTDSTGTITTRTLTGTATTSFLGFVTTGSLVSLSVSLGDGAGDVAWPTVNNLTLANVPAVPEPESWALLLGGLGVVGAVLRRRAKQPA